jgi:hypothetical protein
MLVGPSLIDAAELRLAAVVIYDGAGNPVTSLSGAHPATAAHTTVASSASSVTILAANAARKGARIVNNSSKILYLTFGATTTTAAFTSKLAAGQELEIPTDGYTGIVSGLWSSVNGDAQVTELV